MNLNDFNISLLQQESKHLEEALELMMNYKQLNPYDILFLYPSPEDICKAWDEAYRSVCTYPAYTNVPVIGTSNDNIDLSEEAADIIASVSDRKAFIASVAEKICKDFDVKSDIGWTFSTINVDVPCEIYIFIDSKSWDEVKERVAAYNAKVEAEGYSPLALDESLMMVTGKFDKKPKRGGFFEKRRIRKQNAAHEAELSEFLAGLDKYFRKF